VDGEAAEKGIHQNLLIADKQMEAHYDVVIIGGALAGASMGLLLKRARPETRVLIVEKGTAFKLKVGESTSEVGAAFLTRVLGLGTYLAREQIAKNGLRFWFQSPGNTDVAACSEFGPRMQVRLPAFQLDRSKLDEYVLSLAVDAGCDIRRPATVRELEFGGVGKNRITIATKDGAPETFSAGWVVDASGKAAVIARKRGTLETLHDHPTNSMWCRFRGVRDLDDGTLAASSACYRDRTWGVRATATNHLTGYGWWSWIIPLQGGETSVGITWDRRLFTPPETGTIPERIVAAVKDHALGAWLMENATPVGNDSHAYTQLAYRSMDVMGDGWAAVGDAAGFMDPLYSHGIDFVGNTVWAVRTILLDALNGQCVKERAVAYSRQYQESFMRWFDALYRDKYRYLGDEELMRAAIFMDIGCYFLGPVRLIYSDMDKELALLPYNGPIGAAVGKFMQFYNRRLASLAELRRAKGIWGRRNLRNHCIFRESFVPTVAVRSLILRGMWLWFKCEISSRLAARRASEMPAAPIALEAQSPT
jgi:flavin-dependent dehydrogenase